MTDLDDRKQALRDSARSRRLGLDPALCGAAMAAHVLRDCPPPVGAVVAGFWPLADEIDPRALLHALLDRGHTVALPVTPPRGQPLTFRRWRAGDPLAPGRFGTMVPAGEPMAPDVLLIPLLAFDPAGRRLGYGGGYYDRTLAALPGRFRLGCGFAAQQVDEVPIGPYDCPLDAVATELGVVRFAAA
jgi:5-formyltetrahydrofolate cyclo-ligase